MARKISHGVSTQDLLIGLILDLSPKQCEKLYTELLPRYSTRAKTHLYNEQGEEDPNGKIRLTPYQYKAIRTKFGDSFIKKAFTELTSYIKYLEDNQETNSNYKSKLRDYNSKTHANIIEKGWIYDKCKQYICHDRPQVAIDPYNIGDLETAKEYIKSIHPSLRETAMDVKLLIMKFPELKEVDFE